MSRPTNTPEDASGMRCLGCGYYDDEPQAQRMCEAGEGAGHAFVRVGPDGCVPAPDDDPATLRARLQERYERPERPCTYDPADEEPEAEPVAIHNPNLACRCADCRVALGGIVRYTPPEEPGTFPGVGRWPTTWTGTPDGVSPWPESQRFEAQCPTDDWTPPRPEPVEYSGIPVVVDPEQEEGTVRVVSWTDQTRGLVDSLLDFPAVAPQGEPDPLPVSSWTMWPPASARTVGGSFPCVCGAILRWEGNPDTAANEDGTPHRCSGEPQGRPDPMATRYPSDMFVAPSEPDPRNDVGGLPKKTFDPTWMDDMPVFRLGTKDRPGGFMTYGEMRKQDDATLPPGTVRAALERDPDGTPHTCPTVEPKSLTDDYRGGDVEDTGPAIGRPGLPYRILHAELKSLRSYLRTLTNPDAPAEDVAAALDLLTDEDRELVAALTKRNP